MKQILRFFRKEFIKEKFVKRYGKKNSYYNDDRYENEASRIDWVKEFYAIEFGITVSFFNENWQTFY